jgi:hypothetical protein
MRGGACTACCASACIFLFGSSSAGFLGTDFTCYGLHQLLLQHMITKHDSELTQGTQMAVHLVTYTCLCLQEQLAQYTKWQRSGKERSDQVGGTGSSGYGASSRIPSSCSHIHEVHRKNFYRQVGCRQSAKQSQSMRLISCVTWCGGFNPLQCSQACLPCQHKQCLAPRRGICMLQLCSSTAVRIASSLLT